MGRNKSGGGGALGLISLAVLAVVIQHWQMAIGFGIASMILYGLFKGSSDKKQPIPPNDLGIPIEIEVSSRPKKIRGKVYDQISFYEGFEEIKINSFIVPAHLLYVGDSENQYPHLINPKLSLGSPSSNFSAQMGYWPSYHSITATDRATYLAWLADGRKSPEADIGLVFLYFYGLEYRAVKERKNHIEIFTECVRLFKIYAHSSGSFAKYCGDFIVWLLLENQNWSTVEFKDLPGLLQEFPTFAINFRNVTSTIGNNLPTCDYLSLLFFSHTKLTIAKSIRENQAQLIASFKTRLRNEDPNNYKLSNIPSIFEYKSASSLRLNPKSKFNLSILEDKSAQKLSSIWQECVEEFSVYSKLKRSNEELAHLFIPDGAKDTSNLDILQKISQFLQFDDHKICEVTQLVSIIGMQVNESLTVAQAKTLAIGLERFDVSIEPDARVTSKGMKTNDKVILIKRDLTEIDADRWNKSVALFDLAMAVAISEGDADEKEIIHTLEYIVHQFKLNETEAIRIGYRAMLLKHSNISVSLLAKRISSSLTMNQGESIAKFLFSVAAIDGKIENEEVKTLQKAYKAFNFPPDTLDKLIAEFSSGANGNLVVLRSSSEKKMKIGSTIPSKNTQKSQQPPILNQEALRVAFNEATEVSKLLASVFTEDTESTNQSVPTSTGPILTESEKLILNKLATQNRWNISEVEEMCRKSNIMYGAFLTKINAFFESAHGDTVLEEDGDKLCIATESILWGVRSA